jgi:CubicO group peptidase (beta-lactamase class C family)
MGIPGIAAAVAVQGHEVVAAVGTASATTPQALSAEARFSIGCITKFLISAMCIELVRNGRLDLDVPLAEYLPDLRGTLRGRRQTVRHLLSHRSGFQETNTAAILAQKFDEFARAPQLFEPGGVFSYEHGAYVLVGEILRRVTGRGIDSELANLFLAPLGITPGRVGNDPGNAVSHEFRDEGRYFVPIDVPSFASTGAVSNMTLSILEMARLARHFAVNRDSALMDVQGGDAAAHRSRETECMLPAYVEGTRLLGLPMAFGLGCAQYSRDIFGSDGGYAGQMCCIRLDPVNKVALAVGMNAEAIAVRNGLVKALMHDIGLASTPEVSIIRQSYDFDLGGLAGTYIGANRGTLEVVRTSGGFELHFDYGTPGDHLRVDLQYDPGTNQIRALGGSQQCGLAIFRPPNDEMPCVSSSLSAFRRK